VVSFLALGIVLLAVSVVYARKKRRVDDLPETETAHPG
jgi:LPXTG-motif cell wall-anchored protein